MNGDHPARQDLLAGEYVLGLLRGPARRRFERLLLTDPGLQARTRFWEDRFATWLDALPPVVPAPRVWHAIVARLGRDERAGLGQRLAVAAALVAALALGFLLRPAPAPVFETTHVATVADAAGQPLWLIELDAESARLAVRALLAEPPPAGKSYELWMLPGEGRAPVSLGLLPREGRVVTVLTPDRVVLLRQATGLAVSLEPAGGSPTGLPTGPVLFQAALTAT